MVGSAITVYPLFATPFGETRLANCERLNRELEALFLARENDEHRNPSPSHIPQAETFESRFNLFQWPDSCVQELRALTQEHGYPQWSALVPVFDGQLALMRGDARAAITHLRQGLDATGNLEQAIVSCFLQLLTLFRDSLILRKRGAQEAFEASLLAEQVLKAGWPGTAAGDSALQKLDDWLRAVGHERNPGTTADLVTACLFAALRERIIQLPRVFSAPQTGNGPAND